MGPCHLALLLLSFLSLICSSWAATDLVIGADMSYVNELDCNGTCSPFKVSTESKTEDSLQMLKEYGFTTIRMRIWNDPEPPTLRRSQYCNLHGALLMANRTFKVGLKYHLDFHYSDTWADPGRQNKPAAWSSLWGNDLIDAVYNYTFTVLSALKDQGTLPQSVQIGNEINNGMLHSSSDEPCADYGGNISSPCQDNWPYFAQLVGAGVQATRDVDADIEIMIHTSMGNDLGNGQSAVKWIIEWYGRLYYTYNVTFDSIGLSFDPGFCKCTLSDLDLLGNLMDNFKDCKGGLYIVETSYPYNPNITYSWSSTFPFTPKGQLQYSQALMDVLTGDSINGLRGVMWWGTEYFQSAQQQEQSLWDWNAVALPALLEGFK